MYYRDYYFIVYGKNNLSLVSHWEQNYPKTYKATAINDFPNLYMLLGPGIHLDIKKDIMIFI